MTRRKVGRMEAAMDAIVDEVVDKLDDEAEEDGVEAKSDSQAAGKIIIPPLALDIITIPIIGITPLLMNKFSEKATRMIEQKQQQKPGQKKMPKNPEEDFQNSLHRFPGQPNRYGFPSAGFKKAMVSACRYVSGIKQTYARGAFHILGDLTEITGSEPVMDTAMVRLNSGPRPVADVRYRGRFDKWNAALVIRYNRAAISAEQLVNLCNNAGFCSGVGENRPEKGGQLGMWEVSETMTSIRKES